MKQAKASSYSVFCSYRTAVNVVYFVLTLGLIGCSTHKIVGQTETCNIRSQIEYDMASYLKGRFPEGSPVRLAVIPFDVPETFAQSGPTSNNYGQQLARKLAAKLIEAKTFPIVEIFERDRWPGKRAEFYAGNYTAVEIARAAGYDLVLVGYLEDLTDDQTLNISTKIIDTQNQTTIWSAQTAATSNARVINKMLAVGRIKRQRDDFFAFPERMDEFADCTAKAIGAEK